VFRKSVVIMLLVAEEKPGQATGF